MSGFHGIEGSESSCHLELEGMGCRDTERPLKTTNPQRTFSVCRGELQPPLDTRPATRHPPSRQQHWWPSILDSPSSFCISGNFRVVKLLCFIASCHNIFMDWDYPQSLLWQMTYDLWPIQNKMELKYERAAFKATMFIWRSGCSC